MAQEPAVKQRRYRRHRRGDHSLCLDPVRCWLVDRAPLGDAESLEHGPRAQALWDEMSPDLGPVERLLLEEACRVVDRLDLLRYATEVSALRETRHQIAALRGLLGQIQRATGGDARKPSPGSTSAEPAAPPGTDVVVDLATHLAGRRAQAAGQLP